LALALDLEAVSRDACKAGERGLVRRRHHCHLHELARLTKDVLASRVHQRYRESAVRACSHSGRRCASGPRCSCTRAVMQRIDVQLHAQAARFRRNRSGRSHSGIVRQDRRLDIAFDLQHRLAANVALFRTTASLFDEVGAARSAGLFGENLRVVAHTLGRGLRVQRHVIAVDHGVVFVGSCEVVALPFVQRVGRGLTARAGHNRRLGRVGVEDLVEQVLAVALERRLLIQV